MKRSVVDYGLALRTKWHSATQCLHTQQCEYPEQNSIGFSHLAKFHITSRAWRTDQLSLAKLASRVPVHTLHPVKHQKSLAPHPPQIASLTTSTLDTLPYWYIVADDPFCIAQGKLLFLGFRWASFSSCISYFFLLCFFLILTHRRRNAPILSFFLTLITHHHLALRCWGPIFETVGVGS